MLKRYVANSALMTCIFLTMQSAFAVDIKTTPWPMYQQNSSHTGYLPVMLDPTNFKFDWKKKLGRDDEPGSWDPNISSAIVADKNVYVAHHGYISGALNNDTIQSFSITDGKEIWMQLYREKINAVPTYVGQPSIDNNTLYTQQGGTYTIPSGLYAFNANTGREIFHTKIDSPLFNFLSPPFDENNIYINGSMFGGIYSIEKNHGDINWFSSLPLQLVLNATPSVNDKYVVYYVNGKLYILDKNSGSLITTFSDPYNQFPADSTGFAPVLSGNNALILTSGYLYNFDIKDQHIVWADGKGFAGQFSIDEKNIYAANNGNLLCIDQSTGKIIWSWNKTNETVKGQLIVTNNLVFVSTEKFIYAISKTTHQTVWSYRTNGSLSLGMGHLYVVQEPGILLSFSVI
jgi:outer membrane protein assembly factor BamB